MVDMYKHLDKEKHCNITIELNMEQVADMVLGCNYGLNRFVSTVINRYKNSEYRNERRWAEELERLLESGLY